MIIEAMSVYWLAILAAAVVQFIIGGLWYSPLLFGEAWLQATGFRKEDIEDSQKAGPYLLSLLAGLISLCLLAVLAYALNLQTAGQLVMLAAGLVIGMSVMSMATISIFENRNGRLFLITAGHQSVSFMVAALVMAALI